MKHLTSLETKCDRHFENEIVKLNETFKNVIREIQLCYSMIYKRLESDVCSNKHEIQVARELSSTILGELIVTKKDVDENFEKIVLKMEISPFSEIMETYSSKMKHIEAKILELNRYECDLAQLEENKDYMSQVRNNLRGLVSLRAVEKAKHKKFNSEEVILQGDGSIEGSSQKPSKPDMYAFLRKNNEAQAGSKLQKVWNLNSVKDSQLGIEPKVQLQFRKMTSELIHDGLDYDKELANEVKKLISKVDEVVVGHDSSLKPAPASSNRNNNLSRSESSYLPSSVTTTNIKPAKREQDDYGALDKIPANPKRFNGSLSKNESRGHIKQKTSIANSVLSSKNDEFAKPNSKKTASAPQHSDRLDKFLKKHLTQADLAHSPASSKPALSQPHKSKEASDTQRSESRLSDYLAQSKQQSAAGFGSGGKKTLLKKQQAPTGRSDYFKHCIEARPTAAPAGAKPAPRHSDSQDPARAAQARNLLHLTKILAAKTATEASPARAPASALSPTKPSPAAYSPASPKKHGEASEPAPGQPAVKNNFIYSKLNSKKPAGEPGPKPFSAAHTPGKPAQPDACAHPISIKPQNK